MVIPNVVAEAVVIVGFVFVFELVDNTLGIHFWHQLFENILHDLGYSKPSIHCIHEFYRKYITKKDGFKFQLKSKILLIVKKIYF